MSDEIGKNYHYITYLRYNSLLDTDGQKIALFKYIADNCIYRGISWTRIADALKDIHGDLALSIREKYCSATHGEVIQMYNHVCVTVETDCLSCLYKHTMNVVTM